MNTFSKLNLAIENKGSTSKIIFSRDKKFDNKIIKEFCVFKDYNDIIKHFYTDEPRHYYELFLEDAMCNYFIDLDIKDKEGIKNPEQRLNDIIYTVKEGLTEYFYAQIEKEGNLVIEEIVLKSPATESKVSYHIIFRLQFENNSVYFKDISICKNFFEFMTINKSNNLKSLGIDQIYSKNRSFRILNSSKIEYPNNKLKLIKPLDNPLMSLGSYCPENKDNIVLVKTLTIKKKAKKVKEPII